MSTQLFFRINDAVGTPIVPDWSRGEGDADLRGTTRNWVAKPLLLGRGGNAATPGGAGTATVAGPTAGVEILQTATPIEFISDSLDRDITISGTITANLWGLESSMSANAALGCIVQRLNSQGAIVSTIAQGIAAAELGTGVGVQNFNLTPTSTNMLKGERLRVRVYFDDAPATTMGTAFTVQFRSDGPTAAADGDSYITFTEDFGFLPSPLATQDTDGGFDASVQGSGGTQEEAAQGFTLASDSSVTAADLYMGKNGTPADNAVLNIVSTLDGSSLGTASVAGSAISGTGYVRFTLSSAASLSAGSYFLELQRSGARDTSNYYNWRYNTGNPYAGGSVWRKASGSWTEDSTIDLRFKVIGSTVGSTLYLTDTASAVDPNGVSYDAKEAWTSRGAGVVTAIRDSISGPTAPIFARPTGSGANLEWFTKPLTAFTLSGLVACNIRSRETTTGVNAAVRCEIAVCATDGTSPTIWGASNDGVELGTSEAAMTFNVAGDDTAITDGQRLRIRVYFDDVPGIAMLVVSSGLELFYAGTSAAASGDTYITLPQTVTEFSSSTPITASDSATAADTSTSLDAVLTTPTDTGSGADTALLTAVLAPVTDTASGADVAAVSVPISVTDTAVGADSSATAAAIPVTDTGSGADTAPTLGKTVTDAAVGADTWVNTAQATTDTATGVDASLVTVPVVASDTATGADTVPTLAKATTDAAVGADSSSTTAAIPATDSAAGADTSSLTTGGPTADSNVRGRVGEVFLTGVTGDTFNITGLTSGDRATLLVAFEVQVAPSLTTAAIANTLPPLTQAAAATTGPNTAAIASTLPSLTQAAAAAVLPVASDAAVATDTAALTVALAVTDAGTATDIAPSLGKAVTDAVVGSDVAATLTAVQQVTDTGSVADVSALTAAQPVTDAATAADVSALTAALPVTDTGVATDTVSQRALVTTEAGNASDLAGLNTASTVSANDSGTASDTAVVASVAISATDTGSAVDTATKAIGITGTITSPLPALTQVITAATIVTHAPVYDSFDRADAAIGTSSSGHTWIAQSGTWNISTNRVYRATSEMQSTVVIDSGFTSCSLSVDATFPAALNDAGVVFAATDDSNYLLLVFEATSLTTFELRLWKRDAGTFTLLSGPHPVAAYSNTTVTARVDWDAASGDIELWFGGVQIEAVTLGSTDRDTYATGTRQGLRENAVPSGDKTYFDNYSVGAPSLPKLTTQVLVRNANTTGWSDPASDTTFTGVGTQVIVVTAGV